MGKPFKMRSGNSPMFKQIGSKSQSPAQIKQFGIGKGTSPYMQTDWEAVHKKAIEQDPRYGKMSLEEYKTEARRQMKSKKEGKGWDAMGVYDYKGKKKEKEEVSVNEPADNITENITSAPPESEEKGDKWKDGLKKVGGALVAGFTGGLDAVYGTGKVMPGKTVKAYDPDKKKKDDKSGEDKVDEILA
tara:strand:- start:1748 stop:2311 length:564 start_codon:yes stop_codon:yes gene_type:complete